MQGKESSPTLPDYKKPPVVEVAISIQFDPLKELNVPRLGALWMEFKDDFPETQDQPPLPPVFEVYGQIQPPRFEFALGITPPQRRCWFLNKEGTHLIQVQQDRFVLNWRKSSESDEYIRYENIIKSFDKNYRVFERFLVNEGLGKPKINQCEVTYVNPIISGNVWQNHSQLQKIVAPVSLKHSDSFLPPLENATLTFRYLMKDNDSEPLGRLHIQIEPIYEPKSNKPAYLLKLIARGKPEKNDFRSARKFLDLGHVWIVRGFTSFTTKKMHEEWEMIE